MEGNVENGFYAVLMTNFFVSYSCSHTQEYCDQDGSQLVSFVVAMVPMQSDRYYYGKFSTCCRGVVDVLLKLDLKKDNTCVPVHSGS